MFSFTNISSISYQKGMTTRKQLKKTKERNVRSEKKQEYKKHLKRDNCLFPFKLYLAEIKKNNSQKTFKAKRMQ